jgi:hypothetical protein
MNNKELLINAIEDLLAGDINETYALCENICQKVGDSWAGFKAVREFSKSWEHCSGDVNYPVSGEEIWDQGLDDTLFWWVGEQLEPRMSLLEHIKCEVLKLSDEEFEEMFK